MKINGEIRAWLFPLVGMAIGAAVVWGTTKEQISELKRDGVAHTQVHVLNDSVIRQIDQRLSFIEGALSITERPFSEPKLGIQNK